MRDTALQRVLELLGGPSALAARLGITREAVSQWRRVPADRVLAVEAATGLAVMRSELRPDLYPVEREKVA